MNERIKALLIEAGIYECDDFEPHPTFEKFAELIVKECADIGDLYEGGEYQVRTQILAHFGVEE